MKIRAVIFDLDGTLIFLHFRYTESRKVIIETINKMGLDGSKISLGDTAQIIIEKIEKEIKGRSMDLQISEIKKKIWSIINNFEIESIEISELAKDTKSLLNFLSKEDIKLGIVTNNGSKGTRLTLRKHGIEDYFDVIITRDDVDKLKPYGEGLKLALKMLEVQSNDAVYIGDSFNDVLASKDAGVHSILINKSHSMDKNLEKSPDRIINSLSEVIDLIK